MTTPCTSRPIPNLRRRSGVSREAHAERVGPVLVAGFAAAPEAVCGFSGASPSVTFSSCFCPLRHAVQRRRRIGIGARDEPRQIAHLRQIGMIERQDHVALLHPGFRRRAVRRDIGDQRTALAPAGPAKPRLAAIAA